MMRNPAPWLLVAIALCTGCSPKPAPLPPAPTGLREIAVQVPANKTGQDLLLDNPGVIGRTLGAKKLTVPLVLAGELRARLNDRGFTGETKPSPNAPELRTEIRRWEPYAANYSMVTVDLVTTLVDRASGQELWRAERANWRVQTPNASSLIDASRTASATIAEELLATWSPAGR